MRGWMIAGVLVLLASGVFAGITVGIARAPEPRAVPIDINGGIGATEPIDSEGCTEFAAYKTHDESWLTFLRTPMPGVPARRIMTGGHGWCLVNYRGANGLSGYYQTGHAGAAEHVERGGGHSRIYVVHGSCSSNTIRTKSSPTP